MPAFRACFALVTDYRFAAIILLVVLVACALRGFGAEPEIIIAVLVLSCMSAVYEHRHHQARFRFRAK